jgi:EAL domain-containing protein (putative c-di-GMP-specific phosphodiesterase class I)/GGDEF domain-containing protein
MEDPRELVLLLSGLQALLGFALAGLFAYYHRVYARPHLQLWAASFLALALYLVFAGVALALAPRFLSDTAVRTALALAAQIFAYLHIATLVLGTLALRERAAPPRYLSSGVIGAALVLGVMAALAYVWDAGAWRERLLVRVNIRYFVSAAAYLGVGVALCGGLRGKIGRRMVAIAFLGFGLISLITFLTLSSNNVAVARAGAWLGVGELAAVAAVGIGLVAWLHEEERCRADEQARQMLQMQTHDGATGLPNRRRLAQRIDERIASAPGAAFGVLALRVDGARAVHDALGDTAMAALLLRQAGLIGALTGEPLVARIDEFRLAAVLPDIDGPDDAAARLRDIHRRLHLTEGAGGGRIDADLPVSIGLALHPGDGADGDALVGAAVAAQAGAEQAGGNRVGFWSRDLAERERERLSLLADLRNALRGNELELHFQPIVALPALSWSGAEALLRWRHPRRGLLAPGEFLPLAERAGLMPELDAWVLDAACRFLAGEIAAARALPLSVNVAAPTLECDGYADAVEAALARHGVPPELLRIEVTEAAALAAVQPAASALARLRALGVTVSLDDFGIGHSTLLQLRDLHADCLKIDRAFSAGMVQDGRDAAIVTALVDLGRRLGMQIVVEGIEAEAQVDACRRLGVDFLQGYALARPMPAAEFSALRAAA